MKIHSVTMKGFGPYKETETVNFDAFNDEGLFLITGKTGAGKTSILDAITFALFGNVPRYGNVTDDSVRSKYVVDTDIETRVDLEFSQGPDRYRVSRTPSFTKPGNKNSTAVWAEIVKLLPDGTQEALASRKVSLVNQQIASIVRLNADQFKQVILLAQGAFQEFLLAKSEERRTLLRQLFNSGRFLDYSTDLEEQARVLRTQLAHLGTAVKTQVHTLAAEFGEELPTEFDGTERAEILEWAAPLVAALAERVALAHVAVTEAEAVRAGAENAFSAIQAVAVNQKRLAETQAVAADLDTAKDAIERDRLALDAAAKADAVWVAVEAQITAQLAAEGAAIDHAQALSVFVDAFPGSDSSIGVLAEQAKELAAQFARLEALVHAEKGLTEIANDLELAKSAVLEAEDRHASTALRVQELQDSEPQLKQQIETAAKGAAGENAANQTLGPLESQLAAAQDAERLTRDLQQARAADIQARKASDESSKALTDFKATQYGQFAGVLAQELADGDPCRVCGSTVHPKLAILADGHVTAEQVEEAELEVAAKRDDQAETTDVVTRLETQLKTAEAQSKGEPVAELVANADVARAHLETARQAAESLKELTDQRDALADSLSTASQAQATAKVQLATKQGELKSLDREFTKESTKVGRERGDFASVAERQTRVDSEHRIVETLLETTRALEKATTHFDAASKVCADELARRGFADTVVVKAARLPLAEQERIARKVKSHDEALAVVASTLAEEALQNLPAEPVEIGDLHLAYEDAKRAKSQADQAFGEVNRVQVRTNQLLAEINAAFAESGSAQAEFETVDRLAQTVRGQGPNTKKMTLETFALAADLEEIVAAANVLLVKMTNGRYELRYSDVLTKGKALSGLGLDVIDAYNDERRPPESLSGGEKFQASLALALGLAEVVTNRNGGVRLDTLFIDEGFGALDEDTLSEVLDTIDALREGGRTVGLISHVDKVKERIHNHIHVKVAAGGWSTLA
ncbi:MAG: SMC family ATPase [Actinomycetales bacterium]|nr:SMC family ATPase [Actinomycetales bacterium]